MLKSNFVVASRPCLRLEWICYGFSTFLQQKPTFLMLSSFGNMFGLTATPWVGYCFILKSYLLIYHEVIIYISFP